MNSLTQPHKKFQLARLSIFIKGRPVVQGKYYVLNEKPVFLVNIDEHKLWHNYNGYSIASQILETFSKAKLRPFILYKYTTRNIIYQTTPSMFNKKGVLVSYGSHRQIVLPINKWKIFKEDLQEPFNLPQVSVDNWLKPPRKFYPVYQEDYIKQRMRMKQIFLNVLNK